MRLIEKIQVNKVRKPAFRWICAETRIAHNSRAENLKWALPLLRSDEPFPGGQKRPTEEPPETARPAKRLRTGFKRVSEEGLARVGDGRLLAPGRMPDRPVAVYPSCQWPISIAHVADSKPLGEAPPVPFSERNGWREWAGERPGAPNSGVFEQNGYPVGGQREGGILVGQALCRQVSAPVTVKVETELLPTGPLQRTGGSLGEFWRPCQGPVHPGMTTILQSMAVPTGPSVESSLPGLAPITTKQPERFHTSPLHCSPAKTPAKPNPLPTQAVFLTQPDTRARSPSSPSSSPTDSCPHTTLRCENPPARKLRPILPRTSAYVTASVSPPGPGLALNPSADPWQTPNPKPLPEAPLFPGLFGIQCENAPQSTLHPMYVQYMAACHALYQQFAAPIHTASPTHPAATSYATSQMGATRSPGVNTPPPPSHVIRLPSMQGPVCQVGAGPSPANAWELRSLGQKQGLQQQGLADSPTARQRGTQIVSPGQKRGVLQHGNSPPEQESLTPIRQSPVNGPRLMGMGKRLTAGVTALKGAKPGNAKSGTSPPGIARATG
jgi:hypothetical protein